jgi:hypothetical protein
MKRLIVAAAMFAGTVACAQQLPVIRTMGDSEMRGALKQWEVAYQRLHPEVHFDDKLWGTATGMAGITTGASDITLLGRPVTSNEVIGFEWVHRVKPLGLEMARGPLRGQGKSPALAVMVFRRNPVKALTIAQLVAVLGCPTDASRQVTWAMFGAQVNGLHGLCMPTCLTIKLGREHFCSERCREPRTVGIGQSSTSSATSLAIRLQTRLLQPCAEIAMG